MFGAPAVPGLTTVLLDEAAPESAIYAVAEVPGLHLLPPGPTPPNPAELLDTPRARDLVRTLAERYDTVVVDSPPVLPVTDAQVLARLADAVVLVVAYRETSKRGLARAIELLNQVDAKLIGTILNLVPAKEGYGGQLYRYDTYRSRSERRRERDAAGTKRSGDRTPVKLKPASPGGLPADSGNGASAGEGDGADGPGRHLRADEPR